MNDELHFLEQRVSDLLSLVNNLKEENRRLSNNNSKLNQQVDDLKQQKSEARARVEQMLIRLDSLESNA